MPSKSKSPFGTRWKPAFASMTLARRSRATPFASSPAATTRRRCSQRASDRASPRIRICDFSSPRRNPASSSSNGSTTLVSAAFLLVALCAGSAVAQIPPIPASELRSGVSFGSAELRAMQGDDFANPGMLWVERGQKLWQTPAGATARACASCHSDAAAAMKGVAARYPVFDAATKRVVDVQGRINACRTTQQQAPALVRESEDLLALSAFIAYQSRGVPVA